MHQRRAQAAVCYAPGRWNNGRAWARLNPRRDLTQWLTLAGHLVETVLYRTTRLQSDEDRLAQVGVDDLITDVRDAVSRLRDRGPNLPVFLVGYSLGAALVSLLSVRDGTDEIAGIVLLDGGLHPGEPDDDLSCVGALVRSPSSHLRFRRVAERNLADMPAKTRPQLWMLPRDQEQFRYLVEANDPWWPTRPLRELRDAALEESFLPAWAADPTPVLGVVSQLSGRSARRCRLAVGARGDPPGLLAELPPSWNHVDVVSHPSAPNVWRSIDAWFTQTAPPA